MPETAMSPVAGMLSVRLRNAAVAAGRAILLSLVFAGIGAAIAPGEWPLRMSPYSEHFVSPRISYEVWGVTVAWSLEVIRQVMQSVRARRSSWTLLVLATILCPVLVVAMVCAVPVCTCDDVSVVHDMRPITFIDEAP